MKIKGIVKGEVITSKNGAEYQVKSEDKEYNIVSKGKQATKDLVFIRQGQKIEIEGPAIDDIILNMHSKIDIKNEI